MRPNLDKIEIKDPPIQAFHKPSSCLKRSCMTGSVALLFFVASGLLLLRFATDTRTKEIKKIPEMVASQIPLYDTDNIDVIRYTSGKKKKDVLESVMLIPKVISAPVVIAWHTYMPFGQKENDTIAAMSFKNAFFYILKQPVASERDLIEIEWRELPAQPKFIDEYYQQEFKRKGFAIDVASSSATVRQFTFTKGDVTGSTFIQDAPEDEGTTFILMTIQLPKITDK